MRRLLITIAALAILGVGVSSYALWQHYAPLGSAFCNLGETFSCDLVNKSAFSEVLGIPVALIGILGYAGIGALAVAAYAMVSPPLAEGEREGVGKAHVLRAVLSWLLAAAIGGLAFSLSLTYIEFFVIGAVCILCVTSQALILTITVLAVFAWKQKQPVPYA